MTTVLTRAAAAVTSVPHLSLLQTLRNETAVLLLCFWSSLTQNHVEKTMLQQDSGSAFGVQAYTHVNTLASQV